MLSITCISLLFQACLTVPVPWREDRASGPEDFDNHHVSWSPDGRWLAFDSNQFGNADVFVIRVDGTERRRLTSDPGDDVAPVWSPDGSHLAFQSERQGSKDLYIIRADGSDLVRVTNFNPGAGRPTWSPGGKKLAFTWYTVSPQTVVLIGADGKGQRKLAPGLALDHRVPGWSPDGRFIALSAEVDGNEDLYLVEITKAQDRDTWIRLTSHEGWDGVPNWSLDGTRIAFMSNRHGHWDIFVATLANRSIKRLSFHPKDDAMPVWSPDGKRLAFEANRTGSRQIFLIDADGQNEIQVTGKRPPE